MKWIIFSSSNCMMFTYKKMKNSLLFLPTYTLMEISLSTISSNYKQGCKWLSSSWFINLSFSGELFHKYLFQKNSRSCSKVFMWIWMYLFCDMNSEDLFPFKRQWSKVSGISADLGVVIPCSKHALLALVLLSSGKVQGRVGQQAAAMWAFCADDMLPGCLKTS